jgi:hypothetical protein
MKRAEKEQFRHAESDYFIDSAELSAGARACTAPSFCDSETFEKEAVSERIISN